MVTRKKPRSGTANTKGTPRKGDKKKQSRNACFTRSSKDDDVLETSIDLCPPMTNDARASTRKSKPSKSTNKPKPATKKTSATSTARSSKASKQPMLARQLDPQPQQVTTRTSDTHHMVARKPTIDLTDSPQQDHVKQGDDNDNDKVLRAWWIIKWIFLD